MDSSSFHPSGFLEFCDQLLDTKGFDQEPLFRTVVNRCYLAAYVSVKLALIEQDYFYSENYEDYKRVEGDLRNGFGKIGRFIQEQLSLLRSSRAAVDYEYPCTYPLDKRYLDHKVHLAKKIISKIDTITSNT